MKYIQRIQKLVKQDFKEVEEVFCTTAHTIYHIWIDGKEEIKTTAYHPVYVEGQGWITAINLCECDAIETMDGMDYITKIVKERHEEPVPVYNFHVKEWVSYFVGELKVYVHNGKIENHENGSVPVKEKTKAKKGLFYKSNTKHTPGQSGNRHNAGVEPRNSLELFENSVF